jgi:hypothetical protein
MACSLERIFNPAQQMVGQYGYPDMAVATVFAMMEKWAKSEIALEQSECAFDFSQGNVNVPDGIVGKVFAAASEVIAAVQFSIDLVFFVVTPPGKSPGIQFEIDGVKLGGPGMPSADFTDIPVDGFRSFSQAEFAVILVDPHP